MSDVELKASISISKSIVLKQVWCQDCEDWIDIDRLVPSDDSDDKLSCPNCDEELIQYDNDE